MKAKYLSQLIVEFIANLIINILKFIFGPIIKLFELIAYPIFYELWNTTTNILSMVNIFFLSALLIMVFVCFIYFFGDYILGLFKEKSK